MKNIRMVVVIGMLLLTNNVQAQSWNLVFGLSQFVFLNGGNIEINYLTEKFVFEYSHGSNFSLNSSPNEMALTNMERQQNLDIYVPYSTGGGVGYRFAPAFNMRVSLNSIDLTLHTQPVRRYRIQPKI